MILVNCEKILRLGYCCRYWKSTPYLYTPRTILLLKKPKFLEEPEIQEPDSDETLEEMLDAKEELDAEQPDAEELDMEELDVEELDVEEADMEELVAEAADMEEVDAEELEARHGREPARAVMYITGITER